MADYARRRLLALRPIRGDVLAGEFVQCLWGGPTGYLKSVEPNGMGLVQWLRQPGHNEIIHTSLLKQLPQHSDPAFGPDVREIR